MERSCEQCQYWDRSLVKSDVTYNLSSVKLESVKGKATASLDGSLEITASEHGLVRVRKSNEAR